MDEVDLSPPEIEAPTTPTLQRAAAAFHEAGHAILAMAVGGLVNSIETAERQRCEFQLFIPCDRAAERERATVLVGLAGWRAEYLWHGRGASRDEEDYNEELELGLQQLRNGFLLDEDHDDDIDALADIMRLTPQATDHEICARYAAWSALCYDILREPAIWSGVQKIAAALVQRGNLSGQEVIDLVGGSTRPLIQAAVRVEQARVMKANETPT